MFRKNRLTEEVKLEPKNNQLHETPETRSPEHVSSDAPTPILGVEDAKKYITPDKVQKLMNKKDWSDAIPLLASTSTRKFK